MNASCSGSGGKPGGELLGDVDRAGHLHGMRARAVDGDVGRLVGGRVDAQTCSCGPDLGLVDFGDLALEGELRVVGAGQLQAAQHAAFARLPPRLVARPHHADGVSAVGVEPLAQVAAHRDLALFLADLLNAGGRRRCGVGPVLAAGEGPHIDRLGDLEAVLALAVDDLRVIGGSFRPVQAVAALGLAECLGTAKAERYRAGMQTVAVAVAARQRGEHAGDEEPAERGQQQRATGGCGVQTAPPRHLRRGVFCLVGGQIDPLGCIQHPLHCDRRGGGCDK